MKRFVFWAGVIVADVVVGGVILNALFQFQRWDAGRVIDKKMAQRGPIGFAPMKELPAAPAVEPVSKPALAV